jgi:hypothetical protein
LIGCHERSGNLTFEIDNFLEHFVTSRNDPRIRLKPALRRDQVRELGGEINVRKLQLVLFDPSQTVRAGSLG